VSFTLALVKDDTQTPATDDSSSQATTGSISALTEGKSFSGLALVEYPFTIKITKRKGPQVEGHIKWTLQKCKTKFKGKVSNDELTFEEVEMLEKNDDEEEAASVKIPTLYSGKYHEHPTPSDSAKDVPSISGHFGPAVNVNKGKFTIHLQ